MLTTLAYVLITPARNEAQFIELTLKSVVSQTVKPMKWVIVSDGSTDGTDDIVKKYASEHSWIELIRMPERSERHFAGKAHAFNAGYEKVADLPYEVIGNLDADTSFDEDYFSFLLQKIMGDPELGVVSGRLVDKESGKSYNMKTTVDYVSGPCQIFRRECFEAIGGYRPMKAGGVDMVAVLSARKAGWKAKAFPDRICLHHRPMSGAQLTGFTERLHCGRKDYLLGSHPLWELCRCVYQMKNKPYVIGGVLVLYAYFWRQLLGVERTMPDDLIAFRQRDQMKRLRAVLRGMFFQENDSSVG